MTITTFFGNVLGKFRFLIMKYKVKRCYMSWKKIRTLTFIALAGVVLGNSNTEAHAEGGMSSILPAAGYGSQIEEGSSVQDVKEDVIQLVVEAGTDKNSDGIDQYGADAVKATVTKNKEVVDIFIPTASTAAQQELESFKNLVIARVDNYVNVRDIPSEDGEIVGKLYNNSVGSFIEEQDGWYKITSGNCTGYVKGEYCVTGDEAVSVALEVGNRIATVVDTASLRVREEPSTDAKTLGLVAEGDQLVVSEENDGWVRVDIEEGFGYVSMDYVTLKTEFVTAESKEEEEARLKKEKEERDRANAAAAAKAAKEAAAKAAKEAQANGTATATTTTAPATTVSGSGLGSSVANYGLQFVGNPYVFGGSSLTNGTDCSGFVMSVYANFGVSLPHSSAGDRNVGYDVGGIENAQPGDIICYSGHVAIYIGNGQIVHASTRKTGIVVGNALYRTPLCIRRIF